MAGWNPVDAMTHFRNAAEVTRAGGTMPVIALLFPAAPRNAKEMVDPQQRTAKMTDVHLRVQIWIAFNHRRSSITGGVEGSGAIGPTTYVVSATGPPKRHNFGSLSIEKERRISWDVGALSMLLAF